MKHSSTSSSLYTDTRPDEPCIGGTLKEPMEEVCGNGLTFKEPIEVCLTGVTLIESIGVYLMLDLNLKEALLSAFEWLARTTQSAGIV